MGLNCYISYLYGCLLNVCDCVDQSLVVVLFLVGKVCEFGVLCENWIFLYGCLDVVENKLFLECLFYQCFEVVCFMGVMVFEMVGFGMDDMVLIDFYSCFFLVVEIVMCEFGFVEDDLCGLMMMGGLLYFGGFGNSYLLYVIVEVVCWVCEVLGIYYWVSVNGGNVNKQLVGIYLIEVVFGMWE